MFEIQKYGQILCVHKPYFLMPGHKSALTFTFLIVIDYSGLGGQGNDVILCVGLLLLEEAFQKF